MPLLQVADAEVKPDLLGLNLSSDKAFTIFLADRGHRRRLGLLGARAGGPAVGFRPGNAQDVFIGAGTVALAPSPDAVLPLAYSRVHHWWSGLTAPLGAPAPVGMEDRRYTGGYPSRLIRGGGDQPPNWWTAIVGTPGSGYH